MSLILVFTLADTPS